VLAASSSRILIYGGIGCKRYSCDSCATCTPECIELQVLGDLWELDLFKLFSGQDEAFTRLDMSPILTPITGMHVVPLAGADHRILSFGGASTPYFLDLVAGQMSAPQTTVEAFEYRDLEFRARTATSIAVAGVSSLSSISEVANSTHVILFGGFVRNTLTSAVFTYDLSSSRPSLGLKRQKILATGPKSRGFPGVAKPDDFFLLMFGGVERDIGPQLEGISELWALDLTTQKWEVVHTSEGAHVPTRAAFAAFTTMTIDGQVLLISTGGLEGGYGPNSFQGNAPDGDRQVTNAIWVWFYWQFYEPGLADVWYPSWAFSKDSQMDARCMHSAKDGTFSAGRSSVMIYGGLDRSGRALNDLWYIDTETAEPGYQFELVLRNITAEGFMEEVEIFTDLLNQAFGFDPGQCLQDFTDVCALALAFGVVCSGQAQPQEVMATEEQDQTRVTFVLRYSDWATCFLPVEENEQLWNAAVAAPTLQGTKLSFSTMVQQNFNFEHPMYDGYFLDMWKHSSTSACRQGCMRALCQGNTVDNWDSPELQWVSGTWEIKYCFGDDNSCGSNYDCALPGPRHGHKATSFLLGGSSNILLLFGGETTDLVANSEAWLSREIHAGFFNLDGVIFTKVPVADMYGDLCVDWDSCDWSLCPCERRDASVAVMSNVGSNSGKLLVFGGLSTEGITSPALKFLNRESSSELVALNDLWYIDLNPLTEDCLREGYCDERLQWVKIDVPGQAPAGRWGAGMVLDASDNLYVTGGSTYSTSGGHTELGDLFVFRLRDAFYRKCSATGAGLTTAQAGVTAKFFLQCQDSFGEPANGARFSVSIAGPVDMQPSPLPVGVGLYECQYTPVKAGPGYSITIKVGRGGALYQDLIGGVDSDPTDSVHKYLGYYIDLEVDNPNPFSLTVVPGSTDPLVSTAFGSFLSVSTAGAIGSFVITARDSFANRRPGGDAITVLLTFWDTNTQQAWDPSAVPNSGTVTDNSDGSYGVVYSLTLGGEYQLAISFSGINGADTPSIFEVKTGAAVVANTYAYGNMLNVQAGKVSSIFVQTRDKYFNNIRVDPDETPEGSEKITFELCTSIPVVLDTSKSCYGGQIELSVGITIEYGKGPQGALTNANNEKYFGMYWVQYFPFNPKNYQPLIRQKHADAEEDDSSGGDYISCYFSSQDVDPVTVMCPHPTIVGAEMNCADACVTQNLISSASNARRADGRVTQLNPEGSSARRADTLKQIDPVNQPITISESFVPYNTGKGQWWMIYAVVVCAAVGVGLDLIFTGIGSVSRCMTRKTEESNQAEWAAQSVKAESFQAQSNSAEFSYVSPPTEGNPPVLSSAPAGPVPVKGPTSQEEQFLIDLKEFGMLTPEEVEEAKAQNGTMAQVREMHQRGLARTAMLAKKLLASEHRNGNSGASGLGAGADRNGGNNGSSGPEAGAAFGGNGQGVATGAAEAQARNEKGDSLFVAI